MSNVGTVELDVRGDFGGFMRQFDSEAKSKFGKFERDAEASGRDAGTKGGRGFVEVMKGFIAGEVVMAAVGKLKDAIVAGIGYASDLGEASSKSVEIFGTEGAAAVERFSQGSARNLGQTKLDVIDTASTFGVFGKAAGLAGADLSQFSTKMVTLTSDLASFHNADPAEVATALGAALRGEYEPMRRFGVLLDDASMRTKALEMGLISSTKQGLTPQQKALVANALIMEQTKDAQGDFARTSGGMANQQRILTATLAELGGKLGGYVLPILTTVIQIVNDKFMPALDGLINSISPFAAQVEAALAPVLAIFSAPPVSSNGLATLATDAQVGFSALTAWWTTSFLPALEGLKTAYLNLAATIVPIIREFTDGMIARMQPMMPTVMSIFTSIGSIITSAMTAIQVIVTTVTAIVKVIWDQFGDHIMNAVSIAWTTILGVIDGALKIVSGIFQFWTSLLKGDWKGAWDAMGKILDGAVGIIKTLVVGVTQWILNIWDACAKAIIPILTGMSTWLIGVFSGIHRAIQDTITTIVRAVIDGFTGAVTGAKNVLSGFPGAVQATWNAMLGHVAAFGSQLVEKMRTAFDSMRARVSDGVNAAVDVVRGLPDRVSGAIGDLSGRLFASGAALIDGFIRGLRSKIDDAVATARAGMQRVRDLFPFSPAKTGPFSGSGWVDRSGEAIMTAMATGVERRSGDFASAVRSGLTDAQSLINKSVDAMSDSSWGVPNFLAAVSGTTAAASRGVTTGMAPTVNLTINNPIAERTSDSIRAAHGLALAVGGM